MHYCIGVKGTDRHFLIISVNAEMRTYCTLSIQDSWQSMGSYKTVYLVLCTPLTSFLSGQNQSSYSKTTCFSVIYIIMYQGRATLKKNLPIVYVLSMLHYNHLYNCILLYLEYTNTLNCTDKVAKTSVLKSVMFKAINGTEFVVFLKP